MSSEGEPRWWTLAGHLLLVYTVGGTVLALPFGSGRELPDFRPYLASALGVACVLAVAVLQRSWRVAVGAAVLIPIVAAAVWYAYEVRWNRPLQDVAVGGDPAAIALVLRGEREGWLWGIGTLTMTGSLAALAYALYWMWRLERERANEEP